MRLIVNIAITACTLAAVPAFSQAQVDPARLIQQLLNAPGADRRGAQSAAPHQQQQQQQQQQAQAQPQAPLQPGVWATKGEFLEATRRGELSGISKLAMPHRDAEFEPVLRSITQFLYSDYGVPQLPADRNCHMEYRSAVRDLMRMVTEVTAGSLGDRGPDFQRPTSSAALRDRAQTISRAGGWCDSQPLGREAYACDIRMFRRWGGEVPAKPEVVAKYLASHAARLKVSTLHRRLASISHAHTVRGLKSPTDSRLVRSTLRGIQRMHGCATKQARPLTPELVKRLCKPMKAFSRIRNLRDRALLLVGYTGALRRSELANLERRDVTFTRAGAVIRLRSSKTDPGRKGRDVALPRFGGNLCPVKALKSWMDATEEPAVRPLFRRIDRYGYVYSAGISGEAIGTILRQRLCAARIDPAGYSAHSMRAGFVTTATRAGASVLAIQQQTGQRSIRTVHGYVRGLNPFERNAAHAVWGRVRNG